MEGVADQRGTLAGTGRDTGDTLAGSGSGVGTYGTLTVAANGGYSYVVNASAVNALQAGQTPTDTFTVTVTDSKGATDTRAITINRSDEGGVGVACRSRWPPEPYTKDFDACATLPATLTATHRATGATPSGHGRA